MTDEKTYGQVGFDAYGEEAQWKAFDDRPMPRWDDALRADIKHKWEVAAKAIADKAVADFQREARAKARAILSQPHKGGSMSTDDVLTLLNACVQCRNPDHDGICDCR